MEPHRNRQILLKISRFQLLIIYIFFPAGCHFTEEVGYYLSGPASIDYCAELCLQSAECIGTVLVDSDCFLLSENQTMASGYGIPASASGSYTVRRKECISGKKCLVLQFTNEETNICAGKSHS